MVLVYKPKRPKREMVGDAERKRVDNSSYPV